jgi:hypothetical protein
LFLMISETRSRPDFGSIKSPTRLDFSVGPGSDLGLARLKTLMLGPPP